MYQAASELSGMPYTPAWEVRTQQKFTPCHQWHSSCIFLEIHPITTTMKMLRSFRLALSALFVFGLMGLCSATQADAQSLPSEAKTQVVSANPFGLLLNLFNVEYERVIGESTTAGIGGSTYSGSSDNYINTDVFWRYYPSGNPLNGWAFGVKAGLTKVGDEGTFFGAGFDVNHSWVLGKNDNFYAGLGFGLKRIYVSKDASFDLEFVPTFRIINIGYVF